MYPSTNSQIELWPGPSHGHQQPPTQRSQETVVAGVWEIIEDDFEEVYHSGDTILRHKKDGRYFRDAFHAVKVLSKQWQQ